MSLLESNGPPGTSPSSPDVRLSLKEVGLSGPEAASLFMGAKGDYQLDLAHLNALAIAELEEKFVAQQERLRHVTSRNDVLENRMAYEQQQRFGRARAMGKVCALATFLWLVGLITSHVVDEEMVLPGGPLDWLLGVTKTLGSVAFVTFVAYMAI